MASKLTMTEAVRVAVGFRLGLDICEPYSCRSGLLVDARGLHSLTCKQAPGRSCRHDTLNNLAALALAVAGVPAVKEPAGLVRQDRKTVVCSTADSYTDLAIQGPGSVAEMAASRQEAKYAALQTHHIFQPIAVETLGPINESARAFLDDLGR